MTATWPQPVLGSYKAGADLSAARYKFVKFDGSGNVVAVAAVTDIPIGVLQNAPTSGQTAEVLIVGGSKVKVSAAITLPALIGVDATGFATKIVAGTAVTQYILGVADGEAGIAGAANDIVSAIINCASPARAV